MLGKNMLKGATILSCFLSFNALATEVLECANAPYGEAIFLQPNPANWIYLTLPNLPQTTLISRNRSNGFRQGEVQLTPTGLTLNECGSYAVNFSVFIDNLDSTNSYVVPIFLSKDGAFDPTLVAPQIAAVVTVPAGVIATITGSGILPDVEAGTALSLISGAGNGPANVGILGWTITANKID